MIRRNPVTAAGLIMALTAGILLCRTAATGASIEVPLISIERTKEMLADPDEFPTPIEFRLRISIRR